MNYSDNANISASLSNVSICNSSECYFNDPFKDPFIRCLLITCFSIVFALCFFGNSMVLFAIARSPRLRSMTNFLLANLAIADLCVGAFCVLPNMSTFLQPQWILGQAMCKIYYYIWNVTYTASITILTEIAIERYIAIIHPLRARLLITHRKLKIVQVLTWLVAFIYNIPYIFLYGTFSFGDQEYCYSDFDDIDSLKVLSLVNLVVWYLIPLLIIGCLYYHVAMALWKTTVTSTLRLRQCSDVSDDSSFRSSATQQTLHEMSSKGSMNENNTRFSSFKKKKNKSSSDSVFTSSPSNSSENKALYAGSNCKGKPHCIVNTHAEGMQLEQNGILQPVRDGRDLRDLLQSRTQDRSNHRKVEHTISSCSTRFSNRYRETYPASTRRVYKARKKVIKLLLAVVVTFGICVIPHMIRVFNHYWHVIILPHSIEIIISPISFAVLYMNSALNPILYALFSDTFRRSFKETLPCCRTRSRLRSI